MLTLAQLLAHYNLATGEPIETVLQIIPPDSEIDGVFDSSDDTETSVYANIPQTTVQKDIALVAGVSARLAVGAVQLGFHKSPTQSSIGLLFGSFSIWLDTHALDSSSTDASPVRLCEWDGHLSVDQDWHVTVKGDLTVTQQQFSFRQGKILVTVNQIKPEGLPSAIPAAAAQFFDQAAFLSIEADVIVDTFFDVPGLPGWQIGFGNGESSAAVSVVAILGSDPGVYADAALCVQPPAGDLTPMVQTGDTWTEALDKNGAKRPARILISGGAVAWSANKGFGVFGTPQLTIEPFQIGNTGLIVTCTGLHVCLTDQDPVPSYVPANSRGFAIDSVDVVLPPSVKGVPNDILGSDLFLGTGGFSGKLTGSWAAGTPIQLGGIECQLKSLSLEFKQNSLVGSALACELTIPFFDQPVNLDVTVSGDGTLLASLSASQPAGVTYDNGLVHFEKAGIFKATLEGLSFEEKQGVSKLSLSGQIMPTFPGINWPSFDVRELSIDSNGHVHVDGGLSALPKSYSIDVHGAKLEITEFGIGKTDDGGRYIGMSGAVELVKGMPAGASVEGLKITWYPTGSPKMSLNGIGIKFKTPALSFDGHVSYIQDGADHLFKGDLTLVIPAANNLTLIGKAVFGSRNDGMKYFAIYIEGEFGTGLPLGATGVAMYGIAGLLAVNYAPDKPGTMLWYSINHANSYFHKPETGVTDIIHKWKPESGTFAIGAGITLATYADGGYAFNGKFLLLLLCPGPVLMIDGSAAVMRSLSDHSEPPFHGLIVWDNRAGYFMVGLDARWKKDPQQGDVADISGSMEAFFNFHDPRLWHLWLGKKDPIAQRIQARFAKAFTANSYFMLDARQLAVGVWIGTSKHYKWGPVGADLEAWMAADALVNFKPSQFHADIEFYGHFAIKVFKLRLAITMDARLTADVAKPFHIKGTLDFSIETRIKNFDIHVALEWGPRIDPPEMQVPELVPPDINVPELAPVQSWGITHSKSSNEWPLQVFQAAAPVVVPVDSLPYFTFAFPMCDLHGVGVNSAVPTPEWTIIGDPATGAGSAQAKFTLTGITLFRVVGSNETPIAAHPKPANTPDDFPNIYGSWAPTVPGMSGGQNKLMLWSANPLDFGDNAGSWNPWLSSNLPGYPCPDTKPETICMDFEDLDLGQQIYGSGWHTQNLDFQLAWSDAGPHPIVAASPVVEELDRGLLFSAPKPRKRYRAYVSNFGDNTVSVVDLVTRKVIVTISAGAHPRQVVLSPDGKRAYVCNQDDNTVIVIDTATNQRVGIPIAVIKSPDSMAISRDGKRAFVPSGVDPTMSVIDLQSLQVTTVKLPAVANQAKPSPDGKRLYLMHGPAGAISVITADSLTLIKTLKAAGGPAAMVIHPSQPRAWVSFPSLGTVRLFDTSRDILTALETPTGRWAQDLALSMDGSRLYVGNLKGNTVSVLDTDSLEVVATIATPSPAGLQITPDGATLLVANYRSNTITTVDLDRSRLDQNLVVEQTIAAGQGSDSIAVVPAGARTSGKGLVPVPVEVKIDVPAGSSSVEVTWEGRGSLHGAVSLPSGQAIEVVAASGSKLKLDVALLDPTKTGLALSGIDRIRLRCDSAWTLLRVCVTRLPFAGGLAALQTLNSAFQQQLTVWQNPTFLLDPRQKYKIRLDWSASVKGLNELANWSESFAEFTELTFTTAMPPPLPEKPSDPNVPPRIPSTVKGLDDLSLYVRRTIPATQSPSDEIPVLTKPVFRGYDVAVEFNENYVDQLYLTAGRDLDLILFDRNNEPVRDVFGQLIIVENAWENAPTLTLTETQALWIEMFNANTCGLEPINPTLIPTSKVLRANDAHVLAADSVYEARLVPQLMHQLKIVATYWTAESFAAGAWIFNPGTLPAWTDYRVSVLVTLNTSEPVGILFGYTDSSYYEFTIDPGNHLRRLTQIIGSTATTIREDYYVCVPGQDEPYRIRIEAVGSKILISQNGVIVFTVADATLLTGTVGLRQLATQDVFTDLGVSDLSAGAPVAYRFHFTTSKFTNFYHQIHSFQDQLWAEDWTTPPDVSAAVSSSTSGVLPSAAPTQPFPDEEVRAYDSLALQVFGSASAQDPPQVEVTRLEHEGDIFGWFVRSPEPIDYTRVQITVSVAPRIMARGEAPGAVKITEAELGDTESVTVLAREASDLSGYRVEYRQMPSALADALGSQILWRGDVSGIAGDQTWTDYRASVICRSKVAGGIGIQFRYVDAQNFYAFAYDFTTGSQTLVRIEGGVSFLLASQLGDPAPGIPDAPAVMLTVSVIGSQITCYRAGQKVLQASDDTFALGGAGAYSAGNSSAQFDSLEVHRLPNESYALLEGQFSTSTMSGWLGSGLKKKVVNASSWSNAILRIRMKKIAPGTIGLLFRYQDPNNYYRLLFTNAERRLERVVGGVVTILWRAALTTSMNRANEIVVSLLDTTLSVFQNSILACEVVDASFASGKIGLCKGPGANFEVSQLVLYPSELAFSNWTVQDEFQELSANGWTLVDEGDQGGPSNWEVANGRLTQTSAIHDSNTNPIHRRGTLAINKDANPVDSRLVTSLLADQNGAIGVVFGYQDGSNFYRLSMNATTNVNARYRRLVRCVNGNMTVLWSDTAAFKKGREYVLTLDLIDDYVTAWLDGEQIFRCRLPEAVVGSFGLYCCGNTGASFGNFRVGRAEWNPYYTFGRELPLSAGNRVKIAPTVAEAPNLRTSMRLATELDDTAFNRLPPTGAHLRLVAPDQTVNHGREFIPKEEHTGLQFHALRKADGTGIFIAPLASLAPGQTVKMSFLYHRDNGTVAFTEVGESIDEVVSIDLPTDSENGS